MAHTYGTSSGAINSSSNPITQSFTVDATDTVLVLMLTARPFGTARAGAAPDYGGVAMTQANSLQSSAENDVEIWYLLSPTAGTATVTIPNTGAENIHYVIVTGRAASGNTSALDVTNGGVVTSTNPTLSVTTTVDGDIIFSFIGTDADTWAPSARDGTQIFDQDLGISGAGAQYLLQASLGAQAMGWTFGTSAQWAIVVVAFSEVSIGTTTSTTTTSTSTSTTSTTSSTSTTRSTSTTSTTSSTSTSTSITSTTSSTSTSTTSTTTTTSSSTSSSTTSTSSSTTQTFPYFMTVGLA